MAKKWTNRIIFFSPSNLYLLADAIADLFPGNQFHIEVRMTPLRDTQDETRAAYDVLVGQGSSWGGDEVTVSEAVVKHAPHHRESPLYRFDGLNSTSDHSNGKLIFRIK